MVMGLAAGRSVYQAVAWSNDSNTFMFAIWQVLLRGILEAELALFEQLHRRRRRNRLGHRRDAEDRIGGQQLPCRDIRLPERPLINNAAAIDDDRDDTGDVSPLDGIGQHRVDRSRARTAYICGWRRLPGITGADERDQRDGDEAKPHLLRYSFDCASLLSGVTLSGSMRTIR